MHSWIIGKAEIVTAVLGFFLSTFVGSDLRGEGLGPVVPRYAFEVFRKHIDLMRPRHITDHWNRCQVGYATRKGGIDKGDMEPYRVGYKCFPAGSWSPFRDKDMPNLSGYLPLKADACIFDKIEKSIIEKGECAKRIREYLEFLTAPRFACVFFPLEMFRFGFSRSVDIYNRRERRWCLRGELSCDISRRKLKKDSESFDVFGKYIFYLVKYEEKLSGCIFEMLYCFDADGTMIGWCPSKLMVIWASQVTGVSVWEEFWRLSYFSCISKMDSYPNPFSMKDFE